MLTSTIHQGLIIHTGKIIPILSPYFSWRFPTVYMYTISNWGNVAFLGELVPYAMMLLSPILTCWPFQYRTLLVEVLFNVRLPIVCICGRPESKFAGRHWPRLWCNGEPILPSCSVDWFLSRYSFLARRIWHCQFSFTVTFSPLNLIKFPVSDGKVWLMVIVVRAYFWAVACG